MLFYTKLKRLRKCESIVKSFTFIAHGAKRGNSRGVFKKEDRGCQKRSYKTLINKDVSGLKLSIHNQRLL
ncbi:MAG: hypothetical protein ACI85U_002851, partial [Candidatus Promineifilaceae bacterium]